MSDERISMPFWRYYGGKWRAAPHYPAPRHATIVEPFAGEAGYSLRYHDRQIILVEKYPVLAEMWRWLIAASAAEVIAIPTVEHVDDLPSWVPEGARYLVGFSMNDACVSPKRQLSAGRKRLASMGRRFEGWNENRREMTARQSQLIKHWTIMEGDYSQCPDVEATWFVDPPYNNKVGACYVHGPGAINYHDLGAWCRDRMGQVIVCENEGADWLDFHPFATLKAGINGKGSREVVWTNPMEDGA